MITRSGQGLRRQAGHSCIAPVVRMQAVQTECLFEVSGTPFASPPRSPRFDRRDWPRMTAPRHFIWPYSFIESGSIVRSHVAIGRPE